MYAHTRTALDLTIAGVALALVLTACSAPPAHTPTLPPLPASATPCPTEDSVGCYWDADTMGNGTGRSYTVDTDGTVHYWGCSVVTAYDAQGVQVPVLGHDCAYPE